MPCSDTTTVAAKSDAMLPVPVGSYFWFPCFGFRILQPIELGTLRRVWYEPIENTTWTGLDNMPFAWKCAARLGLQKPGWVYRSRRATLELCKANTATQLTPELPELPFRGPAPAPPNAKAFSDPPQPERQQGKRQRTQQRPFKLPAGVAAEQAATPRGPSAAEEVSCMFAIQADAESRAQQPSAKSWEVCIAA